MSFNQWIGGNFDCVVYKIYYLVYVSLLLCYRTISKMSHNRHKIIGKNSFFPQTKSIFTNDFGERKSDPFLEQYYIIVMLWIMSILTSIRRAKYPQYSDWLSSKNQISRASNGKYCTIFIPLVAFLGPD